MFLKKRSKRGIIKGFGLIFKALFGLTDNDDDKYFNEKINRASKKESELADVREKESELAELADGILFSKSNTLYLAIISPTQTVEHLQKSLFLLPEGSRFPINPEKETVSSQIFDFFFL